MVLQKVVGRYEKPYKTQTIGQKGSNMASNDLKKILLMIESFLIRFFQKWGVGVFKFGLSPKMILQKIANEYSNYRRIQTIGARHFNYCLK